MIDKAILRRRAGQFRDGLLELNEAELMFEYSDNRLLKAKYHNITAQMHAGIARVEGEHEFFRMALHEYAAALAFLEACEPKDFLSIAVILNNIANTLLGLGLCDEAHARIDRAEVIFNDAGEQAWLGQLYDTRAKTYIEQELFKEAIRWASRAVLILMDGVESDPYEEAKKTLARALSGEGEKESE